jgi:hypothetical protein
MNKRLAKQIIQILRVKAQDAQDQHIKASCDRDGAIASASAWEQMNPMDGVGGMSLNPYRSDNADKRAMDARNHMETMQEVYDYAVDTFIGDEE